MVEYIKEQDSLNTGRKIINEELTRSNNNADKAKIDSAEALLKAIASMNLSESIRNELNQIVIEGDSSVEAAQARVDEKGQTHPTLKQRIDDGFEKTTSQLNETNSQLAHIADKVGDLNTIDLFMTMGQSNMAGRGEAEYAPLVPNGFGYEFRAISDPTKLYNIEEPFGVNENFSSGISEPGRKTGSMISSFAIAYYKSTKIPGVFVSASKGGSSINQWQPNSSFLNDAISRLNNAKVWLQNNGYTIRHTYMLWCQGETDGDNNMTKYEYTKKLEAMINEMVNQGVEKCFIVRIGNHRDEPNKYNDIINAQTDFCITRPNTVLISTKFDEFADKGLMKDAFHYKQEAYNLVGDEAGKNCALFVKNSIPPSLPDYENDTLYHPFEVNGDRKIEFPFDTNNENGSFDVVSGGVIENGYIDTRTTQGYKKIPNSIILNSVREWSIEFTIHPSQVVSGYSQSGIILINAETPAKNFVFVNNDSDFIRLRDNNNTNFDFSVDKVILDEKHNYCITYDGKGGLSLYIDATLHQTINVSSTITDIEFKNILGGFSRTTTGYDGTFNFRGLCYYIGYINKMLMPSQMHIE